MKEATTFTTFTFKPEQPFSKIEAVPESELELAAEKLGKHIENGLDTVALLLFCGLVIGGCLV